MTAALVRRAQERGRPIGIGRHQDPRVPLKDVRDEGVLRQRVRLGNRQAGRRGRRGCGRGAGRCGVARGCRRAWARAGFGGRIAVRPSAAACSGDRSRHHDDDRGTEQPDAPGDAIPCSAPRSRRPAGQSSPATCGRTRTSGSRPPRPLRPRAQPDRAALPTSLPSEHRYQIARRVVGAEMQYITYNEFLRRMGVGLAPYRGYKPRVDPTLVQRVRDRRLPGAQHGARRVRDRRRGRPVQPAQLDAFAARRASWSSRTATRYARRAAEPRVRQPGPAGAVGLGPAARRASGERQYKNDEQIDDSLRSVLFEVPKPRTTEPARAWTPGRRRRASPASRTSGAPTSRVAATTGCRATTRCAGVRAARRRRSFTADHRRGDRLPNDPRSTPALRSTTRQPGHQRAVRR